MEIKVREPRMEPIGAGLMTHDYPCPVKVDTHAVWHSDCGVFRPSWAAQAEGWQLVRVGKHCRWLLRVLDQSGAYDG